MFEGACANATRRRRRSPLKAEASEPGAVGGQGSKGVKATRVLEDRLLKLRYASGKRVACEAKSVEKFVFGVSVESSRCSGERFHFRSQRWRCVVQGSFRMAMCGRVESGLVGRSPRLANYLDKSRRQ